MAARPALVDIDADGDQDLFVGNLLGELARFTNIGTATSPSFVLADSAYITAPNGFYLSPTFVDIDNDGDKDLFAGMFDGKVKFFRNAGTPQLPQFTASPFITDTINTGGTSAPTFADIDNDGDKDLFIGKRNGTISFYRNVGSVVNFIPSLVTETFLGVSITNEPNLTPTICDYDSDSDLDFFFGAQDGALQFYENIGTPTNAQFVFVTDRFAGIAATQETAPGFADIDGDGDQELFVGVKKGGIHFYRNNRVGTLVPSGAEIPSETRLLPNYPNPFNPTTKIKFVISRGSPVILRVFDIVGKEISTLVDQTLQAGIYAITWDAARMPSGVYYCRLTTPSTTQTIKLLLLK
jgi:hypothetical protein